MKSVFFIVTDFINTIIVLCRCSIICIIAVFFNFSFLYILPLALIVDWGIFQYSYQATFKSQLRELNNIINEFIDRKAEIEKIEDDIINEIDKEMRKYQLSIWGDRYGKKQIAVVRVNKVFGRFMSVAFYNSTSVIFVPKTFYPNSIKDRVLLVHEFAHCISHDLMLMFRKQLYISTILFSAVVVFSNISIWLSIVTVAIAVIFSLLQIWPIAYNEIVANNHALEVIETLYGSDSMMEAAKCLLNVRKESLDSLRNVMKKKGGVAIVVESLQIEFLQKCIQTRTLIWKISPMNIYLSFIYWILFVLAMYSSIASVQIIEASWQLLPASVCLFILLYYLFKIYISRIWKTRNLTFRRIGLQ